MIGNKTIETRLAIECINSLLENNPEQRNKMLSAFKLFVLRLLADDNVNRESMVCNLKDALEAMITTDDTRELTDRMLDSILAAKNVAQFLGETDQEDLLNFYENSLRKF